VKMGPDGRSRGFGFINFQEHGAVRWVLQETHVMDGRKLAGYRHKTRHCAEASLAASKGSEKHLGYHQIHEHGHCFDRWA